MATITTSIGAGTSHDTNNTISAVAGAGPWTVTVSDGSAADVGDALWDEHDTPRKYLITGIAGDVLTVEDHEGVGGAPDNSGTSQAETKRYYNGSTPLGDWETDLDDSNVYSNGDDAVGECWNDNNTAFDESIDIDGGGSITLSSVTLTVHSTQRHDGTGGSGARIVRTAGTTYIIEISHGYSATVTLEWLEIDANNTSNYACVFVNSAYATTVRNCLIHQVNVTNPAYGIRLAANGQAHAVLNNFIYDIRSNYNSAGAVEVYGIWKEAAVNAAFYCINNTVQGIEAKKLDAYGIFYNDDADEVISNNLVADVSSLSGSAACFSDNSPSNATAETNASDDSTAPGPIAGEPVASGTEFTGIVEGSENLHLDSGAECADTTTNPGTDKGTSPGGVEIDIDGRDRDAEGDTWCVGADQYVAAGGAITGATTVYLILSGTLGGTGALTGSTTTLFAPSGTLGATGALDGVAICLFSPIATLQATGALSGSATVRVSASGTVGGIGALSGSATVLFTASATPLLAGGIDGTSTVIFAASGTLAATGALAGSTTVLLTTSATIQATGALAGSTTVLFSPAGTLTAVGSLSGTTTVKIAPAGTLIGQGALSGTAQTTFAPSGTLIATGASALQGSTSLRFAPSGTLKGSGRLAGAAAMIFAASGTLRQASIAGPYIVVASAIHVAGPVRAQLYASGIGASEIYTSGPVRAQVSA